MVQISVLSGSKAGSRTVVRYFPFSVGRAPENHLQLDDDGVWGQHLMLELHKDGFGLSVAPDALVTVNSGPFKGQILHNGDIITIGSAKLQFWLAPARQRGLRFRESFVWALVIAVTVAQFALIYWLIR
jgi:pSer/pThr/pTyr-binding forkhead associated (FHA) protein